MDQLSRDGKLTEQRQLVTRKLVQTALKSLLRPKKLGQHPLTRLHLITIRCQMMDDPLNETGHGLALRKLLTGAIKDLELADGYVNPNEKCWRIYYCF